MYVLRFPGARPRSYFFVSAFLISRLGFTPKAAVILESGQIETNRHTIVARAVYENTVILEVIMNALQDFPDLNRGDMLEDINTIG
jgi:hypothetical protein